MPRTFAFLPETDYQVMETTRNEFEEIYRRLPSDDMRYFVCNVTHRLAEVDWIGCQLEDQVRCEKAPSFQEGLLSLQFYLLLTCADTLGHVYSTGGVGKRFRAFFDKLQQDAKEKLTGGIFAWKTDIAELDLLGLADVSAKKIIYPTREQIWRAIYPLTTDERYEMVVSSLYCRRNEYTHESEYPQLGHHPNLSVMQNQRLNVPSTSDLGEYDRLQQMCDANNNYFVYYETDDIIATVRWVILRGLGKAIGWV